LLIADPGEDTSWLDKQVEEFTKSDINIEGLLKKQEAQYTKA